MKSGNYENNRVLVVDDQHEITTTLKRCEPQFCTAIDG